MPKFDMEGSLGEFFSECDEILQRITSCLTRLESQELSAEVIDSLYRDVHTLKGSSQLFGFQRIGLIAHAIEASLEPVRKNKMTLEKKFVDQVFKSLDLIDRILKNPKMDLENDPKLQNELLEILPKLVAFSNKRFGSEFELTHGNIPVEDTKPQQLSELMKIHSPLPSQKNEPIKLESKAPEQIIREVKNMENNPPVVETQEISPKGKVEKSSSGDEQQLESSTIRVQVGLLDKLMNLVGEMVLARNQVLQFASTSDNNDFLNLTQRLDLVTTELQDNVMKTRMQPIGTMFTKFQRVVRDLARDLNKSIDLVIEGAETELDKSILEAIKDPMTHIVRNSCDHGIEDPEERKKKGKRPNGKIILKAYHEGGHVIIEISDDGRGLDPKKILSKALEKRIITPDKAETMSDAEIQQLIFAPGFSTAAQVSSVSGRGVGMDVVKTNIERVGGMIDLNGVVNEGTRIRLIIPLTLAIVPAMIIRSNKEYFAIPQVKLQELIRVDLEENAKSVEKLQGHYVYRLRGDLLPLIDLAGLIEPSDKKNVKTVFNIVVLKSEGHTYGLIVDEICDTADIVVKPLPQFLKKVNIFSGATIMGDGSVALILDIQGVAERSGVHWANQNKDIKARNDMAGTKPKYDESTEYLFFKLSQGGTFSIPLILVHRLEEFLSSEIEISGHEKMVKYRGSLLPIIDLNEYLGHKSLPKTNSDEKTAVIVVSKHNRLFGLAVNEILDILTSNQEVTSPLKEIKGVFGTIIFNDKQIVTILDALGIVDDSLGIQKETKKVKKLTGLRVLLLEDTIFFTRQVTKVLTKAGIEVDHVENGQLALDKLKKVGSDHYHLIVSDIEMPVLNGYEFAKALRADANFQKTPLLALTTRFNEMDRKKGKEVGFTKYLEKLKSDELLDAINEYVGDI